MQPVQYIANTTQNTERGPSEVLWGGAGSRNAWLTDFIRDPRLGHYVIEDWDPAPNFPGGSYTGAFGRWSIYSTTGGAIADDGIIGGGVQFKGGTTAGQGITVASSAGAFQLINASGVKQLKLVFECRVKVSTGSFSNSTQDSFCGLFDNLPPQINVPITATPGTLAASTNFIGFHKRGGTTNANDWNFVFAASGQTIQYPTNLQTLITTVLGNAPSVGTYYKLGFIWDSANQPSQTITSVGSSNQAVGQYAKPNLTVWVNGLRAPAFLVNADVTAATFPQGIMSPGFSFMQQSTTAGIYTANDWYGCAQSFQN